MRDAFRRALNKRKVKGGQAGKKFKKWKYEDEMVFLRPYFTEKISSTSVDMSNDEDFDSAVGDSDECLVKLEQDLDTNSKIATITLDGSSRFSNNTMPNLIANCAKAKNESEPPETLMTASSELMTQLLEDKKREFDELDHFFLNMSATVKKFSPYQQAIVKHEVFSIVSNMEIQRFASLGYENCSHPSIITPTSSNNAT